MSLRWNWNRVFARFHRNKSDGFYDLVMGNCFGVLIEPIRDADGKITDQRRFTGGWLNNPSDFEWWLDNYFEPDPFTFVELSAGESDEFNIHRDDDPDEPIIGNELRDLETLLKKKGIKVRWVAEIKP